MECFSIEDAYEKIEDLRENGLPDILCFNNNFRAVYLFGSYKNCATITDNMGNIMSKKEMKKLISYLEYSVENLDEEEIINENILYFKNEIKKYKNHQKEEPKRPKIGEVYLIRGENGRHKIGYSKDAENRAKTLSLSSCEKHELVHKFKCKNPQVKEQELHIYFSDKRCHSEWFDLSEDDVEYIKSFKDESGVA